MVLPSRVKRGGRKADGLMSTGTGKDATKAGSEWDGVDRRRVKYGRRKGDMTDRFKPVVAGLIPLFITGGLTVAVAWGVVQTKVWTIESQNSQLNVQVLQLSRTLASMESTLGYVRDDLKEVRSELKELRASHMVK